MFSLVQQQRRDVVAFAYWLGGLADCSVLALQARYCYCGAFCKCESKRGRVLSDFLSRACAHGALCDLDNADSHAPRAR